MGVHGPGVTACASHYTHTHTHTKRENQLLHLHLHSSITQHATKALTCEPWQHFLYNTCHLLPQLPPKA